MVKNNRSFANGLRSVLLAAGLASQNNLLGAGVLVGPVAATSRVTLQRTNNRTGSPSRWLHAS